MIQDDSSRHLPRPCLPREPGETLRVARLAIELSIESEGFFDGVG